MEKTLKPSDLYKARLERLEGKMEACRAEYGTGGNWPSAVGRTGDHYRRAKALEDLSDEQNRIGLLNGDVEFISLRKRARDNLAGDSVYQLLDRVWRKSDEVFTDLRKGRKLKYKFNSRQNPSAKRHRQVFGNAIFQAFRRMENRTMGEEEYTMISENPETWFSKVYVDTRDFLDTHDERKVELLRKHKSREKLTEDEQKELLILALSV
jgi:hypothetical protein